MQKYTIVKIARFTKNKEGGPLVTKDGRPYTSLRLQLQEYGQKWVSGFGNAFNANWKEGDEVELIVDKKGEYLNFHTLKKEDLTNDKFEQILGKLTQMNLLLQSIRANVVPGKTGPVYTEVDYPEADETNTPNFLPNFLP